MLGFEGFCSGMVNLHSSLTSSSMILIRNIYYDKDSHGDKGDDVNDDDNGDKKVLEVIKKMIEVTKMFMMEVMKMI